MTTDRRIARDPLTRAAGHELASLNAPCVGCRGLCRASIALMTLPGAVPGQGVGA